ncbi:MAG: acyl carrier protein [Myxococcales bacterium]|nr:acyl carrier protein [Myxococcales bacterium]
MTTARERLRLFITDTFFVDDFGDSDSFLRTRIIDSTGMMELVAFLETDFRVKVADAELLPENLDSVENLVGFLKKKGVQ